MMITHASAQAFSGMPNSAAGQGIEVSGRIHPDIWSARADGVVSYLENNVWKQHPTARVKKISASFETKRPWVIGLDDMPWRFDGTNFNQVSSTVALKQISARDYNMAIGVKMDGSIVRYDEGIGWTPVAANITAKHCSLAKDGDLIWCTDNNRNVWRRGCRDPQGVFLAGVADVVDVYDYNRVVITDSQTQKNYAYMLGNYHWGSLQYTALSGLCLQASISDTYLYCTAGDNSLWWAPYGTQSF